jgi:hypothetical protein
MTMRSTVVRGMAAIVGFAVMIAGAAGDNLAYLNDEFSADTRANWLRRSVTEGGESQLERWEINPVDAPGQMVMMPYTCTWYQPFRGPLVYQNVTGDFAITTSVTVTNRAGTGTPSADYSLAGIMLRVAPNPAAGPENYVFLSIGHGVGGSPQFEVKSTMNGTSNLVLSASGTLTAQLQVARVGDQIITLYRRPFDTGWVVHRVYDADSLNPLFDHTLGTGQLQVGLVTYSDWPKASTFAPAYHNTSALTIADNGQSNNPGQGFNPDLIARFDYVRFARLLVPGGFANGASNAAYLAVLGDNAVPVPCVANGIASPCDIASDDGTPLPPWGIRGTNNGVTEGDYNAFFSGFFTPEPWCDIANDQGQPLPGDPGSVNNGVTEADYNVFFAYYFEGCGG